MRSVLTVLLLATLGLATPLSAGDTPTLVQAVRPLQSPVVDEESGEAVLRNVCTVASINEQAHYWLTAAHCLGPEMLIANHVAYAVFHDDVADLAILYTAHYSAPALTLRPTAPTLEDAITMSGYPVGLGDLQVFRGHISSLHSLVHEEPYMLFDLTACHGNSGSAVVDAEGRVISVLQIAFGHGCDPFSGGAPWEVVVRLVGDYFG